MPRSFRLSVWLCLGVAACLLAGWDGDIGAAHRLLPEPLQPSAAQAAMQCATPSEGDLVQGSGAQVYLYAGGALHQVPDLATLRALGYDPNAVDPIRDDCLRALRMGDAVPSAGHGDRVAASRADTADVSVRPGPAMAILAGAPEVPRGTTVPLTARADVPDAPGLVLSISRTAPDGRGASSGLVTRCAGKAVCSVDVWDDEPITWTYVATLYSCPDPSMCVAVQESDSVSVTWR